MGKGKNLVHESMGEKHYMSTSILSIELKT
jgi:hypothetical protein